MALLNASTSGPKEGGFNRLVGDISRRKKEFFLAAAGVLTALSLSANLLLQRSKPVNINPQIP